MAQKILGALFFIGALLILVGDIANGTLFSDQGSEASTYGIFLGTLIPIVIYVFSGFFLFTFDNATKLSYIDGFKKRSKQSSKFIIFIVAYTILMIFATIGVSKSYTDSFTLSFIKAIIPYIIPLTIFVALLQMYAFPHNASKKNFINNDAALNEYLSPNETFSSYSDDNFVLASNKALYFPQLFCVIPFNQISSVKLTKQLWEQDVYFNLVNGKKFYIVTKHYEHIQDAINANSQV